MKLRELFGRQGFFLDFLIYLSALLCACVICIFAKGGDKAVENVLDFGAYVFPILAGVLAGGGIYFEDDAEFLFGSSCLCLLLGFTSYMQTKGFGEIVVMASLMLCGVWIFNDLWTRVDEVAQRRGVLGLARWVTERAAFLLVACVAIISLLRRM